MAVRADNCATAWSSGVVASAGSLCPNPVRTVALWGVAVLAALLLALALPSGFAFGADDDLVAAQLAPNQQNGLSAQGNSSGLSAQALSDDELKRPRGIPTLSSDVAYSGTFTWNANCWWVFLKEDANVFGETFKKGTLLIGAGGDKNKTVEERAVVGYNSSTRKWEWDGSELPWIQAGVDVKDIKAVVGFGMIQPKNLVGVGTVHENVSSSWFGGDTTACHSNLECFDGRGIDVSACSDLAGLLWKAGSGLPSGSSLSIDVSGWDTSKITSFAYAFYGCSKLPSLDISSWDMSKSLSSATHVNMLAGCTSLSVIKLSQKSAIEGCGLDGVAGRTVTENGVWVSSSTDGWLGSSASLIARHAAASGPTGVTTYTWTMGLKGGALANSNCWWRYFREAGTLRYWNPRTGGYADMWCAAGTLALGAGAGSNKAVSLASLEQPWKKELSASQPVNHIVTVGSLQPTNMFQAFGSLETAGSWYSNLQSFDGSGLETSRATNMEGLFGYDTKLTTITGISGWNTSRVTTFNRAFEGCKALPSLDISGWTMSATANNTSLLAGCEALTTLTLGTGCVLDNPGRFGSTTRDGAWRATVVTAGSSPVPTGALTRDELAGVYPNGGNKFGTVRWNWVERYAIAFVANLNGAKGTMPAMHVVVGDSCTLPRPDESMDPMTYDIANHSTNLYFKPGWVLRGWNTAANGAGTSYGAGEVIKPTGAMTLYAQWTEDHNAITYARNGNGWVREADGGANLDSFTNDLPAQSGSASGAWAQPNQGYHFVGWRSSLTGDEYISVNPNLTQAAVDNVAKAAGVYVNATFTAVFQPNTYLVSYDANGGTWTQAVADQTMVYDQANSLVACAANLTREGYSLAGWNSAADGSGNSFSDGQQVQNLTDANQGTVRLYAQWTAVPVTPPAAVETPSEPQDTTPSAPEPTTTNTLTEVTPTPVTPTTDTTNTTGTSETTSTVPVVEAVGRAVQNAAGNEILQVDAVSSSPIVVGGSADSGSGSAGGTVATYFDSQESYWSATAGEPENLAETFTNMSTSEKVRVAGNVVTTLAAVSAIAGLLGVGVSVGAAAMASLLGVVGAAGATGAVDLAAELAAASVSRRRKDDEDEDGSNGAANGYAMATDGN